jgi:ABC-2 type transport system permease protein
MFNLLKREIVSRRNAILGWGIGLALFATMYIGIYPEMSEDLLSMDLSDISFYQAMGIEMGSLEGYLSSTVLQFMTIILSIYALIGGTGILAGEEDNGTLELIVAAPLARWQIVTVKAIALGIVLLLILVIAGAVAVTVFSAIDVDTELTAADLFRAILTSWPIVFAFAMLSFFLGAYLPGRRVAAMVATVLFIASYFGEGLLGLVTSLERFQPLSLFYYFDTSPAIFTEGAAFADVAVLLGVALVFFLLALLSFQRRDITVGAWPWQRARRGSSPPAQPSRP